MIAYLPARPASITAVGVALLAISGCGSQPPVSSAPPQSRILSASTADSTSTTSDDFGTAPAPPPAAVAASINRVAVGGIKAVMSADTLVDADPSDTVNRAARWLTPSFAIQVRLHPPLAAPGASWMRWAAHKAHVLVSTRLGGDDHPPDTVTKADRQVIAVLRPVGRDGWTGREQTVVVFVTLARAAGQWRIAGLQQSDPTTGPAVDAESGHQAHGRSRG